MKHPFLLVKSRLSLHFPRHSSQGQLGVLHGPTDAQVATGLVPHAEGPEPFSPHAAIGPDAGPLCALVQWGRCWTLACLRRLIMDFFSGISLWVSHSFPSNHHHSNHLRSTRTWHGSCFDVERSLRSKLQKKTRGAVRWPRKSLISEKKQNWTTGA